VNAAGQNPYNCVGYRLPTESEWEYAYRAGTTTAFYNGEITDDDCADPNLDQIGWYCGNSDVQVHSVGEKESNAWGLYDMAGNVWEWCWDGYVPYLGAVSDPLGPATGSDRVIRGGSFGNGASDARAADRDFLGPSSRIGSLGFRLARTAP
jgi:formylglycine-generating enzyme required for sulfatase activity